MSRPSASTDPLARLIGPVVVVDTSGLIAAVNDRSSLDLLTLDERHFRVLRGPDDQPFRLLPVDR